VVEDLQCGGLKVIQRDALFKFGLDSVLLANFSRAPINSTVVDLCSGSSVISVLMSAKTMAARIVGVEISDEFVDMAKRSISLNKLDDKVSVLKGDVREIHQLFTKGGAGVVVVNPPYIKQSGGLKPADVNKSIAKHEIMCSLKDVISAAAFLLPAGGCFFIVYKPQRLVDLLCQMREFEIEPKYLKAVHPRYNQKPSLVLVEGVKSAGSGLVFLPPLFVYDESGAYITQSNLERLSAR